MDFEQQEILNEICWIVNQRNIWARKRKHHRNRLYRSGLKIQAMKDLAIIASQDLTDADQRQAELHAQLKVAFDSVNAERLGLKKFTKRLKFLLKQINGRLMPDSNAGCEAIRIEKRIDSPDDGYQWRRLPLYRHVHRHEIEKLALSYETHLAISSMLK